MSLNSINKGNIDLMSKYGKEPIHKSKFYFF